jgi:thioredoxin-like negative regulator of GroEL
MSEIIARLGLLVLVSAITWLLVLASKRFVEVKRRQALAAAPLWASTDTTGDAVMSGSSRVRILAFSSEDCQQCKRLQAPALERVLAARREAVTITEVDATTEHTLTQAYHVLTVPSTVILDTAGNAHAVNYGFTNTQRLLTQVDELLSLQ